MSHMILLRFVGVPLPELEVSDLGLMSWDGQADPAARGSQVGAPYCLIVPHRAALAPSSSIFAKSTECLRRDVRTVVRCHSQEPSCTSSARRPLPFLSQPLSMLLGMPFRSSKQLKDTIYQSFCALSRGICETPLNRVYLQTHCFVNKVVLEYSHVHLLTYHVWPILCHGRVESLPQTSMACRA